MGIKKGQRLRVDHELVRLRGRYGAAVQNGDQDEIRRTREALDRYREEKKIREAQAVLAAAWFEDVAR